MPKRNMDAESPMRVSRIVLAVSLGLVSSCTTRTYPGAARGADDVARIEFHATDGSSITDLAVDGVAVGVVATAAEALPGTRNFTLKYNFDETKCDARHEWCEVTTHYGVCSGNIQAQAGNAYLVTVSQKYANVGISVNPKGYFDLSNRADEPNPGSATCKETSTSYSSSRDVTSPPRY